MVAVDQVDATGQVLVQLTLGDSPGQGIQQQANIFPRPHHKAVGAASGVNTQNPVVGLPLDPQVPRGTGVGRHGPHLPSKLPQLDGISKYRVGLVLGGVNAVHARLLVPVTLAVQRRIVLDEHVRYGTVHRKACGSGRWGEINFLSGHLKCGARNQRHQARAAFPPSTQLQHAVGHQVAHSQPSIKRVALLAQVGHYRLTQPLLKVGR